MKPYRKQPEDFHDVG